MKNLSNWGIMILAMLFLAGCSNEDFTPEIPETLDATHKEGPAFLKSANAFAGPLFDLVTAPNKDILVADATKGITDIYGNVEAVLPGVTSVDLVGKGMMWATTGPAGDPTQDNGQALYRVFKNRTELVVNLFAFEAEDNPDGEEIPDSNPYSVVALSANKALVVDSGGNDLLRVDHKGNVEVLAVFPKQLVSTQDIKNLAGCPPDSDEGLCGLPPMMPTEAVPTSVVIGPDGYYYVSELKGFPSPLGVANIWRVSPDASGAMCGESPDCVKVFDGGFTSIIDMAFDKNGMLYVAEMDVNGWFAVEAFSLVTGGVIKACDPETLECNVIASGIPLLTAITFDKKGKLWATQNALIPGMAEVVEIPLN